MYSQVELIKPLVNMVFIRIDRAESAFVDYVIRYIKKNFAYSIFLDSAIIIYPKPADTIKRNFFLKCIIYNYNKTREDKISIDDEKEVPIYIDFTSDSVDLGYACIGVRRYDAQTLTIRLYSHKAELFALLKDSLGSSLLIIDRVSGLARVKVLNLATFYTIKSILKMSLCTASATVRFLYSEEEMRLFFSESMESLAPKKSKNSANRLDYYYNALGCNATDSIEKVRKNYRKLAKKYHPDRVFGLDHSVVSRYTQKFLEIQTAYENICNYLLPQAKAV